ARITAANVVVVTGVAGTRLRRADVHVAGVVHGQRLVEAADAVDLGRAGVNRAAGVGLGGGRAGHRHGGRGLADGERAAAVAGVVVGVAGVAGAGAGRADVDVVGVAHRQDLVEA